jgi:S1-C subfamily serine protease
MWLTIRTGPFSGRVVEVSGDRFVVGRDEECDLTLPDDNASRRHAYLAALPDGSARLHDLSSTNGTWVDGRRIREPFLLGGSEEIVVGDTRMVTSRTPPSAQPTGMHAAPVPPAAVPPPAAAPPPAVAMDRPPGPATLERAQLRRGVRTATLLAVGAVLVGGALVALALTGVIGGERALGPARARTVAEIVSEARSSTFEVEILEGGRTVSGGTGWVLDAERGLLVTAEHVVNGAQEIRVSAGDSTRAAQIVGAAPCEDLAVLRVEDASGMRTLPLGSQAELEQGETVVALGFPSTLVADDELTATTGVVSVARARFGEDALDVPAYPNVVQTDAAINPGNSGGPLVDLEGRLVGVNTAINRGDPGGQIIEGQGYAIGVDRVKELVAELREGRSRAWTGMGFDFPGLSEDADSLGLPDRAGLIVRTVVPGSPADRAGLGRQPVLVTEVDGQALDGSLPSYCRAVGDARTGDTAVFTLVVGGGTSSQDVQVSFG